MAKVQDPTVQRRRLRIELRKARDTAGLKQAEVARAMDWSPSKLIRIESGQVSISTNDLKALLSLYGVKDTHRVNGLLELAKTTRGSSFYEQFNDLLKAGFSEYLAYEGSASVVRQYDPVLVPGLLQTEEYGRAILSDAGWLKPEEVDRVWAVRQHRQELHDREDPPTMLFILDEAALRRRVGRGAVMRHQLERLIAAADEKHITLQVLPFASGAHPGILGNFIMLEFDDPGLGDIIHVESMNEITVRDDTQIISLYLEKFYKLEELSLPPEESKEMLAEISKEMAPDVDTTAGSTRVAS